MKTREQKIKQAIKIYFLLQGKTKSEKYNLIEAQILDYIMSNVNNPDYFISDDCDIKLNIVEQIYKKSMRDKIIFL